MQSRADLNVDPSPVAAAAAADRWQVVRRLVELGAAPDSSARTLSESESSVTTVKNSGTETAVTPVLILAVKAGEQELVEFLCSNGASPNLMDDTSSACGAAAAANHLGILKLLAEAQADLDRMAIASNIPCIFCEVSASLLLDSSILGTHSVVVQAVRKESQ